MQSGCGQSAPALGASGGHWLFLGLTRKTQFLNPEKLCTVVVASLPCPEDRRWSRVSLGSTRGKPYLNPGKPHTVMVASLACPGDLRWSRFCLRLTRKTHTLTRKTPYTMVLEPCHTNLINCDIGMWEDFFSVNPKETTLTPKKTVSGIIEWHRYNE